MSVIWLVISTRLNPSEVSPVHVIDRLICFTNQPSTENVFQKCSSRIINKNKNIQEKENIFFITNMDQDLKQQNMDQLNDARNDAMGPEDPARAGPSDRDCLADNAGLEGQEHPDSRENAEQKTETVESESNKGSSPVSGTPKSFRDFQCSAKSVDQSEAVTDPNPLRTHDALEPREPFEVDPPPSIDLTPIKQADPVSAPVPKSDGDVRDPLNHDHVCLNKLSAPSVVSRSRHDFISDSSPADSPSLIDVEPGTVLDPENEGDQAILNKIGSGTSNITGDLEQLQPGQSPDRSPIVPSTPECPDIHDPDNKGNDNRSSSGAGHWDPSPPPHTEVDDPKDEAGKTKECSKNSDQLDQHEAFDHCLKHCQNHDMSARDSSDSCDPQSSQYSGGMAGLDPDHSSEWVPSFIDPDMSKSKKRRRRYKLKREGIKKNDSLGKLLSGQQTKEEAEQISTFDLGNQRHSEKKAKMIEEKEILSGNLIQRGQGSIQDLGEDQGAATFNSTMMGSDFGDADILRDDSKEEEQLKDDDINDKKSKEGTDSIDEVAEDLSKESVSSNSTGTKRKRKRSKKNVQIKQSKTEAPPASSSIPENAGRATRSKAQTRTVDTLEDKVDTKTEEPKGEKEKHPNRKEQAAPVVSPVVSGTRALEVFRRGSTDGPADDQAKKEGQVLLFKQPKVLTRFDIQRVVSKAVQKSRSRVSNNFAFNSKIQKFKITTDSANVPKFPELDPLAPLQELMVPEFIWSDPDKTMAGMVKVKSRGVIQFVVLARSGQVAHESWDTPTLDMTRDFVSFLLCTISDLKLEFGTTLRWTNPWGSVAVVGLDSGDMDKLQKFRTFFTTLKYNHHYFNTFPKDALTNSLGLYVMLKNELREFKEECLAEALFARNRLHGVLDTLEAETFTASDTTRAGVSKNGWRNVLLQGDEEFMASLSDFPALHWFNLGPATVQIHGGERRAETYEEMEAKNKRKRMNMPLGQTLSNAAKASISQSFLIDQKNLLLSKKSKKSNAPAPAPLQPQKPDGAKAPPKKKK